MKNLVLTLVMAITLTACSGDPTTPAAGPATPAEPEKKSAPAFSLTTVSNFDRTEFTSADIQGKIAIVDFWATWCAPCIAEIPHYNETLEKYKDKGVVIVGMTIQSGDIDEVKKEIPSMNIRYPLVMGTDDVVDGFGGVFGFPTTFIVDQKGRIHQKILGNRPNKKAIIEQEIDQLLAQ